MASVACTNTECDQRGVRCDCPENFLPAVESGEAKCGTCGEPVRLVER